MIRVREDHQRGLDPGVADERELLKPYPAEGAEAHPVSSTGVNSPRNNDASPLEPLAGRA